MISNISLLTLAGHHWPHTWTSRWWRDWRSAGWGRRARPGRALRCRGAGRLCREEHLTEGRVFTQLIGKNESKSSLLHCLVNKHLSPIDNNNKNNNIIICHWEENKSSSHSILGSVTCGDVSKELLIVSIPFYGVERGPTFLWHPVLAAHTDVLSHLCSEKSSVLLLQYENTGDNTPLHWSELQLIKGFL